MLPLKLYYLSLGERSKSTSRFRVRARWQMKLHSRPPEHWIPAPAHYCPE